ncbi:MAG: NUDIX domain-containing protein [Bacteroidota bacterium]
MSEDLEKFITSFEMEIDGLLPSVSVDCVILGFEAQELKVLLLQWKNSEKWALPGGFVKQNEHLDDAALRVLEKRTGLSNIFLKQFHTFGSLERSTIKKLDKGLKALLELHKQNEKVYEWVNRRFITTAYFALSDIRKTHPVPDVLSQKCEWKSITSLPELILDHHTILEKALDDLRTQLNYLPIGQSLLPEKFTMQDLKKLYEAVLGRPLDRGNFQRKMLRLGILVRQGKLMSGASNKAPFLYSFDRKVYQKLLHEGMGFSY